MDYYRIYAWLSFYDMDDRDGWVAYVSYTCAPTGTMLGY